MPIISILFRFKLPYSILQSNDDTCKGIWNKVVNLKSESRKVVIKKMTMSLHGKTDFFVENRIRKSKTLGKTTCTTQFSKCTKIPIKKVSTSTIFPTV